MRLTSKPLPILSLALFSLAALACQTSGVRERAMSVARATMPERGLPDAVSARQSAESAQFTWIVRTDADEAAYVEMVDARLSDYRLTALGGHRFAFTRVEEGATAIDWT